MCLSAVPCHPFLLSHTTTTCAVMTQVSVSGCQWSGPLLRPRHYGWRQTATLTREMQNQDYSEVILGSNSVPDWGYRLGLLYRLSSDIQPLWGATALHENAELQRVKMLNLAVPCGIVVQNFQIILCNPEWYAGQHVSVTNKAKDKNIQIALHLSSSH